MSANAATAPSGIRTANPSSGTVVHLVEAANDPSTLCAEDSSTGAASASANIATTPPGFSAANLPTGTTFVSTGTEADPAVAGAVSTDATLAPTSAAAVPKGTNTAALAANAAPAAPVSSPAAFSKSPSVGGYTARTLEAMMHHDTPSYSLSKFITTEAIQGGVIAITTTKITRQHDIVSFSQATACRQILWIDSPWTGGEIEPAWENYYESQGYKPTATCKEYGFKKLRVLTSLTPTEVLPSPPSPPRSWCCLECPSLKGCVGAQRRRPELTMTNCEQDLCKYPAGHSRAQETRACCLLPRVLALHRFPAQQGDNNSTGADDQAQNRRIQNR